MSNDWAMERALTVLACRHTLGRMEFLDFVATALRQASREGMEAAIAMLNKRADFLWTRLTTGPERYRFQAMWQDRAEELRGQAAAIQSLIDREGNADKTGEVK